MHQSVRTCGAFGLVNLDDSRKNVYWVLTMSIGPQKPACYCAAGVHDAEVRKDNEARLSVTGVRERLLKKV